VRAFSLLAANKTDQAIEAFLEVLRLDPTASGARRGLADAMRHRNWVYAMFSRVEWWLVRLDPRILTTLSAGTAIGVRLLRAAGLVSPAILPLALVIIGGLLFLLWLHFAIEPLANLVLRFDPIGRYALEDREKDESAVVGLLVAISVAGLVAFVAGSTAGGYVALAAASTVVPVMGAFRARIRWRRWIHTALAMSCLVLAAVAVTYATLPGLAAPGRDFDFLLYAMATAFGSFIVRW
jgi:hypothetical protein